MCSVARGSTKRGGLPGSLTSSGISTPEGPDVLVELRLGLLRSARGSPRCAAVGNRAKARALILSSTSVMLRTYVTDLGP